MEKKYFDVIIVGGGAAGIMAAISCKRHNPNYSVAIIDRTFALGRKILVCGAGRCNITNLNLGKELEKRYYGASTSFIKSIFDQFGYQDIVDFFEELGIELYVERKTDVGKLFPTTNQAKTVTALLEDELSRLKVQVFLNTEVMKISKNSVFSLKVKTKEGLERVFSSKYLIVSAGGMTYPALGSNGSGYNLSEDIGHKIIEPVPSALPLESKNKLSHLLQGVKLEAEVTSVIEGIEIKKSIDDVMFTQYGLSGPAILNISREISIQINRLKKKECFVKLNFLPGKDLSQIKDFLQNRWNKRPEQNIEMSLMGLFPSKFPASFLQVIEVDSHKKVSDLNSEEKAKIIDNLFAYTFEISATRGWNEAEFTAGGIDTDDIKIGTLESQVVDMLCFCGEILNVDGDVGGFNLSWAWSSGFVAGKLK